MPKNTETCTKWDLKTLHDWFTDYQERNPNSPCPESFLTPSTSKEDLNAYLTVFIAEARNQAGELVSSKNYLFYYY